MQSIMCNTLTCYVHDEIFFIIQLRRPEHQFYFHASRRGASDRVTDSSVLSNPADAHNVSFLGLCGRDFCPKSSA